MVKKYIFTVNLCIELEEITYDGFGRMDIGTSLFIPNCGADFFILDFMDSLWQSANLCNKTA